MSKKVQEVLEKLRDAKRMDLIRKYYGEFSKLVPDIEEQRAFIVDSTTAEVFHFATSKYLEMPKEELLEALKYKPFNNENNPFVEEYASLCTERLDVSRMAKDDVDYYFYHNRPLSWSYDPDLEDKVEYFKWKYLLEKTIDDSGIDKTSILEVKKLMSSFKEGKISIFTQSSLFGCGDYYEPQLIYQKYLDSIDNSSVKTSDSFSKRKEMIRIKKSFITYLRSGVNFFLDTEGMRERIQEIKRVEHKFFLDKMKKILNQESKSFIYNTKWTFILKTDEEMKGEALRISGELWSL